MDNIEQVFEEWDAYARKKQLIARDIKCNSIIKNSDLKIIAITGIRRSGKTSALILIYNILKEKKEKTAYINLEDNRIKNNPNVLDEIIKWFGDEGYLILDEITNVKDWEGWLSRNHEMLKGKLRLIISSSRSNLAVPNKALRGRILPYELYPLSFKEFLKFKNIKIEKTTAGIGRIEKSLEDYIIYGGFPEVVLFDNKTEKVNLVNSYFKDIIGLDVAEISKENISTVETFGKYIIEAPYFSASKCLNFFKSAGYKIAKQTLLNLEKYSQESYLFFFIQISSKNIKNKSQYPRKAYLGDTSFMYSILGKKNLGRLYENLVFLELKRKLLKNREIGYWKNKKGVESDFVIKEGLTIKEIIQVVYDMKEKETKEREINGILECAKELKIKNGLIITKDIEESKTINGVKINFIPLWKWLLSN